ncbi:MAG: hypothetical protein M1834_003350 [Cirrosporium novae-zelandiae]|nr:MAG: hypothetical protein M1834_003350 [Cirrosporium novae-zelandiae]
MDMAQNSRQGDGEKRGAVEQVTVVGEQVMDGDVDVGIVQDWSPKEEVKARQKIDFILLPIVGLAFFALQLDRGNISTALTSTITEDLGINTNMINVGTQLLSAGIVLLEIPSNVILQRMGPQLWLSGQILAWGSVATFQAFIHNRAGYLITRLLLGLLEAGFIPGSLYFLSTWYRKSETSLRVTCFFLGQMLSSATSSLIGAGILTMSGKHGLAGWQWLFLIEGIITIFIGFIFILFLPPTVGNGYPLISRGKWSYFTPRESHIMINRVLVDDPAKARGGIRITGGNILDTVKQPRIWVHVLITMTSVISIQGLSTYTPSIVKSFGYGTIQANALASVGYYGCVVLTMCLAFLSDRTYRRGPFVLVSITWQLITYACLRTILYRVSKWHRYAILMLANVPNSAIHVLNIGWLSVNCKTAQQRSVAMAMIVMAANTGGIAGSQVFRTEDAPKYLRAFTAIVALAASGWVITALQIGQYIWSNRRIEKHVGEEQESIGEEEKGEPVEEGKRVWKWAW